MKKLIVASSMLIAALLPGLAQASEGGKHLKEVDISLDQDTLRKGLTVFTDICMGCHSAKYLTYRGLMDYPELGLTREEVDELRGANALLDGLKTELAPEDASAAYGKVPPDLSVIANGRRGGGRYVYSLLTGYSEDPEGKIDYGNYNEYFPGKRVAMPDPLAWIGHDEADTATLEEDARAVASFLVFVSDPHQLQRKKIGWGVMIFLLLLTGVLYLLKREVWKDIKH